MSNQQTTKTTNNKEFEEYVSLLKSDFKVFLYVVWQHLGLPEPTKIQYEIADYLQYDEISGNRRMIQAYRGIGKTFVTGAYVVWRLFKDGDYKFLIVSATATFSEEISMFIKNILSNMPITQHLNPALTNRNSVVKFDVPTRTNDDKAPSVKVAGITGQITGSRANEIIVDDAEIKKNSQTQTMRDGLLEVIKEFTNIIVPGGKITYLGTPQTEDTIYNKLGDNYKIRVWPSRYPKLDEIDNYDRLLSDGKTKINMLAPSIREAVEANPDIYWEPTNPQQHNDLDLIERELDSGKSNYMLQYQLNTSLSDAERYPLKVSDLIIYDLNPLKAPKSISYGKNAKSIVQTLVDKNVAMRGDFYYGPIFVDEEWQEYDGVIMSIDPSGKGKDETGYSIVAILNGYLFVLDSGAIPGGYDEKALQKMYDLASEHNVKLIIMEENAAGGAVAELLKGVIKLNQDNISIETFTSSTKKEERIIDTLEPVMNRHKIVFNSAIIEREYYDKNLPLENKLMYQMTRITREKNSLKHDDRIDALSMAIGYWQDYISLNNKEIIEDKEQEQNDKLLEAFVNDDLLYIISGGKRSNSNLDSFLGNNNYSFLNLKR